MDRNTPQPVNCKICGNAYTLPEVGTMGNLPHTLLCGHVFCGVCLEILEADNIVLCPECAVESVLPEGGVYGLQEDSQIIGLLYTSRMNEMKRMVLGTPSNRGARLCRKSNCPPQVPPPTPTADRQDVSTDNGQSARHTDSPTHPIIQTDTGRSSAPPPNATPKTCEGPEPGEAEASGTQEVRPAGRDHRWRDGQDPLERGARPHQCVAPPVDVNQVENLLDEALVQAAENMAQLEHLHQTLVGGRASQALRDQERLRAEIDESVAQATQLLLLRRDSLRGQSAALEVRFPGSEAQLQAVWDRMEALQLAMKKARALQLHPSLERYCHLQQMLQTLQAPVVTESYDLRCLTLGSGLGCVLQTHLLSDGLNTALQLQNGPPRLLPEQTPPAEKEALRQPPLEQDRGGLLTPPMRPPTPARPPTPPMRPPTPARPPTPPMRPPTPARPPTTRHVPDVIIEDLIEEEEEQQCEAPAPHRPPWVQVTHVVTPSHFYVRYVAEGSEAAMLSQKISALTSRASSCFTSDQALETGSQVLVRDGVHGWSRGIVLRLARAGPADVTSCPVHLLTGATIFLPDYGTTTTLCLDRVVMDEHMRRLDPHMKTELDATAPLAVKCSLKDLVPADLKSGWCEQARKALRWVVGSAVVELQVFSREEDFLLVDLRKPPMDAASTCPASVREYLVFIELARFYSPLTPSRALQFYPPVHPRIQSEHSAIVTHVNTPHDFYIQLVGNMEVHLLSSQLQTCYERGGDGGLRLYCPTLTQACVARHRGNLWARARITGVRGGRTVAVQYVDTGDEATVSVANLRKIKDEFFSLPAMAIHCSLADVVPVDGVAWSQTSSDFFSSLVLNKPVSVIATGPAGGQQLAVRVLGGAVLGGAVLGALEDLAGRLVSEQQALHRDGWVAPRRARGTVLWDPPIQDPSLEPRPQTPVSQDPEPRPQTPLGQDPEPRPQTPLGQDPEPRPQTPLGQDPELRPQLRLPAVMEKVRVKVTHIASPGRFYVQLLENEGLLQRVCARVQACAQGACARGGVWRENTLCAAQVDGVWERAEILADVSPDDIAEVRRCDFGGRVKLHVSGLRPLPASLEGSLALECSLAGIRPAGGPTWTATASDYFSQYLSGAVALMTAKEPTEERPLPVVLFYPHRDGQLNLAQLLANKGLALRERKPRETSKPRAAEEHQPPYGLPPSPAPCSPDHAPEPHPHTYQSAEKVKTELYEAPDLPGLGHHRMRVSAVGEDGVIYLQTRHAEGRLEQLRLRVQARLQSSPQQQPYTWKSVLGCALMGPDRLWYRAQVLEVLRDLVRVRYVDYGSVEDVPVVHVYPTLLCEDVPQLCTPCRLNAVLPVGRAWQKDALALLRELLLQRSVDVQVLEVPADPRGSPTVEIFLDGLSLSQILCHHQHVHLDQNLLRQQVRTVTPLLPSLDYWSISTQGLGVPQGSVLGPFTYPRLPLDCSEFTVQVKHICTPDELFIWPLEGSTHDDGSALDQMLTRVTAEVDRLPHLSFFPPGGPCLAQYGDGQFYRARLMEISSADPLTLMVQHVDYGSYEVLPTCKLRQMPAEMLRFPARALRARLAGFRPPQTPPGGGVLPYARCWSVEALRCMCGLLHGRLCARVQSHEPELTVLLYDEEQQPVHLLLLRRGLADPAPTSPRSSAPTSPRSSSPTSSSRSDR